MNWKSLSTAALCATLPLISAACSSLPSSPAPTQALIPRPALIPAETQDAVPGILDALETPNEAGQVILTERQAQQTISLLVFLQLEREKLRAARAATR